MSDEAFSCNIYMEIIMYIHRFSGCRAKYEQGNVVVCWAVVCCGVRRPSKPSMLDKNHSLYYFFNNVIKNIYIRLNSFIAQYI